MASKYTSKCKWRVQSLVVSLVVSFVIGFVVVGLSSNSVSYANSGDSDSYASDSESPMSAVMVALDEEDYQTAITELKVLIAKEGESADALKEYDTAYDFYSRALKIDPNHLGATEYLGELYVETEQPDKANEQLERIYEICQSYCREYVQSGEPSAASCLCSSFSSTGTMSLTHFSSLWRIINQNSDLTSQRVASSRSRLTTDMRYRYIESGRCRRFRYDAQKLLFAYSRR